MEDENGTHVKGYQVVIPDSEGGADDEDTVSNVRDRGGG